MAVVQKSQQTSKKPKRCFAVDLLVCLCKETSLQQPSIHSTGIHSSNAKRHRSLTSKDSASHSYSQEWQQQGPFLSSVCQSVLPAPINPYTRVLVPSPALLPYVDPWLCTSFNCIMNWMFLSPEQRCCIYNLFLVLGWFLYWAVLTSEVFQRHPWSLHSSSRHKKYFSWYQCSFSAYGQAPLFLNSPENKVTGYFIYICLKKSYFCTAINNSINEALQ